MSETLIKVEGVSKKFCRSLKKSLWYGVQDLSNEILGRRHGGHGELRSGEFWAVNDVSFELKRGECLGLIGRNGAGKTTLLRMLNGLIKPDRGRIDTRGRVGALIALGAGFNPVLTGRENIYVNAAVLGLSKREIDVRLEEMIEFAELGDFIDTPVQSYSSGMQVRLGFAIATTLNYDALLLDEVLAVGDAAFQVKCLNRIRGLKASGTSILFVSHSDRQVALITDRCLLLQPDRQAFLGETSTVMNLYRRRRLKAQIDRRHITSPLSDYSDGVEICDLRLHGGGPDGCLSTTHPAKIELVLCIQRPLPNASLELRFWNSSGHVVAVLESSALGASLDLQIGLQTIRVEISNLTLMPDTYRLAGGLRLAHEIVCWAVELATLEVTSDRFSAASGMVSMPATISVGVGAHSAVPSKAALVERSV